MNAPTLFGAAGIVPSAVPLVCFEVWGKPGHKARHRSRIVIPKEAWSYGPRGEKFMGPTGAKMIFVHNYPDPDTEAYERMLAQMAALQMRGRPPSEAPLALLVHAFRAVPPSWSKKDREAALAGLIAPTSRPDWDNYGKITDALNGIAWKDDSQVVDGRVIKRFSSDPALRVEVRELVPAPLGKAGIAGVAVAEPIIGV